MALRATKGDEDARCGRTLWRLLVVCDRRAWRFRCFFPVSSTGRSAAIRDCTSEIVGLPASRTNPTCGDWNSWRRLDP
jgi:hypothetical protein